MRRKWMRHNLHVGFTIFIPRVELYNSGIIDYIRADEMYVVCIATDVGQGNQAARNVLTLI